MPTIFQFWDRNLPVDAYTAIESWRSLNPSFDHRLFNEAEARQFGQMQFGSRFSAAFDRCRLPSMKSDLFRYAALQVCGGIYADVDLVCHRPIIDLFLSSERGVLIIRNPESQDSILPTGFMIVRKAADKLLEYSLSKALKNIEMRTENSAWRVCGPGIQSLLYRQDKTQFDGFSIIHIDELARWARFDEAAAYKVNQIHWSVFQQTNSIFSE